MTTPMRDTQSYLAYAYEPTGIASGQRIVEQGIFSSPGAHALCTRYEDTMESHKP